MNVSTPTSSTQSTTAGVPRNSQAAQLPTQPELFYHLEQVPAQDLSSSSASNEALSYSFNTATEAFRTVKENEALKKENEALKKEISNLRSAQSQSTRVPFSKYK